MNYNLPQHFSYRLELNTEKLPARISDRTNWPFLLPGIIFGGLLFLLGGYEIIHGFKNLKSGADVLDVGDVLEYEPLIDPIFFDVIFMLVGLGIIVASVAAYIRYKKIIFDGKSVFIGCRSVSGKKTAVKESIKNYSGVRFRIEFYQLGFLNKNRYIIELYHKDPSKIIPLYISTSSKNIRKIWEKYARQLNLPALVNTDEGLISREIKNLDKSLKEMAELGYIIDNYNAEEKHPSTVAFARKKDKIVLKARKIVWDAYNIMAWAAILFIGGLTLAALLLPQSFAEHFSALPLCSIGGGAAAVIIIAVFILFRKEKLVLKKHKIVNTHKYMLFSTKHDEMPKAEIEAIDVTENPVSGRYFVSIISDEKTIEFGAKLPIEDLRWIKRFLIHEVIK